MAGSAANMKKFFGQSMVKFDLNILRAFRKSVPEKVLYNHCVNIHIKIKCLTFSK